MLTWFWILRVVLILCLVWSDFGILVSCTVSSCWNRYLYLLSASLRSCWQSCTRGSASNQPYIQSFTWVRTTQRLISGISARWRRSRNFVTSMPGSVPTVSLRTLWTTTSNHYSCLDLVSSNLCSLSSLPRDCPPNISRNFIWAGLSFSTNSSKKCLGSYHFSQSQHFRHSSTWLSRTEWERLIMGFKL